MVNKLSDPSDRTATIGTRALTLPETEAEIIVMLYHRDGVTVVPLREGRPVVVGRSAPSSVIVAEPSISRRHARFTMVGEMLRVEDLGSTNGTHVGGERIEQMEVRPGSALRIGGVHCVTYVRGAKERPAAGLLGHEPFMAALARAITEARFFSDGAGLLMVRVVTKDGEPEHVSRWVSRVGEHIRKVDLVGLYSPGIIEVLLPRATRSDMQTIAAAITALSDVKMTFLCAASTFPNHAAAADALLERTRHLLSATSTEAPLKLAGKDEDGVARTHDMLVHSEEMRQELRHFDRIAAAKMPVLILGETGVGKEVLARAVHAASPRAEGPFVAVNCGAIPQQLVEGTLFGHERGAFTGALQESPGVFGAANGGTVLLDEIGELPADAQAALLRTLETGQVTRVGSAEPISVDVRIMAATHRDLEAMVLEGTFREDLLYRINALVMAIPALRDRPGDIAPLAERFLSRADKVVGSLTVRGISDDAMEALRRHDWPGNIRELRNVIERACVLAEGELIVPDDLPDRVCVQATAAVPARGGDIGNMREHLRDYERSILVAALRATKGNQTRAAARLEVPIRTLTHKLKGFEITKSDYLDKE